MYSTYIMQISYVHCKQPRIAESVIEPLTGGTKPKTPKYSMVV